MGDFFGVCINNAVYTILYLESANYIIIKGGLLWKKIVIPKKK